MPVGLEVPEKLLPVNGIRIGVVESGIRYANRKDLVMFEMCEGTSVAATFTQNRFCAAPVVVAKQNLKKQSPRILLINTGNANAGTGEKGLEAAHSCCAAAAKVAGIDSSQVLPFSTGVIGEYLPLQKILAGLDKAYQVLAEDAWHDAATGIMTTDIVPKGISKTLEIDNQTVTITGIAKGSGMIHPNMATMLSFIATDACIDQDLLQSCLSKAVKTSFNRASVDGDTSTNDACILMATNKARHSKITDIESPQFMLFYQAFYEICLWLAQSLVRDGEGATKFITVAVKGGRNEQDCAEVALTVAHSPLVKTAFFASDPNWGRILAAIGRANIDELNLSKVNISLDDVNIVKNGEKASTYVEADGQKVMDRQEITIHIELGLGDAAATVWTSDLSHEYIRINAEYRS